ncbi:hypothetical protein F4679DRAFT_559733 [Xylaria curta]|nr:hypothetical protein F4679DRAFT_559733 [Xylaria curta]
MTHLESGVASARLIMHMSRLVPAILVLGGLAQVMASLKDGVNEVRETIIAEDGLGEEASAQELSARDSAAPERQRWCRSGEHWDRRWHRCYRPLRRPSCPRGEYACCSRGGRDWVPYGEFDIIAYLVYYLRSYSLAFTIGRV